MRTSELTGALNFLEQYGKNLEAAGFTRGQALQACRILFETKVGDEAEAIPAAKGNTQ